MKIGCWMFKYKWIILFFILSLSSILLLKACRNEKGNLKQKKKVESFMDNKIKKVVLDNGLTILAFKNTQTPKVLLQIAYDVGSWVEQEGERGMAHLIEHMIFKGTDKLSEGDIDSISRKYGATFNAFTGKDMTSYFFEVDKNNWHPFVGILADCMQNARFESEHLASEFRTVIQELRMLSDNSSRAMVDEAASIIYPSNYPYHFPIIGFKQDLVNMKAENLKSFYKKYYKPERATLFIVGDIDPDEAIEVAINNFENIPDGKFEDVILQDQDSMFDLIPNTRTSETSIYEDVQKEQLGFYWLIPGLRTKGSEEIVSIVEFILGQGEGSRLYKRLVEEEKVAVDVSCMGHQLMEAGIFFIFVEPLNGKAAECKKFITEEINKLIKDGIQKKELEKVVTAREREFFQNLQNLTSFTYEWIKSFIATRDELDVFTKVEKLEKIDTTEIQKFVKHFLDPFFMNKIAVLPLPEDKKEVWLKLKQESDKLDKLILETHPRTAPLEEPRFVHSLPDPKDLRFEFPKPDKEFELPNGLTVLISKNEHWPIFAANCRFKQSGYFSESKEGIFLNFMMNFLMEGTENFNKEDNVDFFERHGSLYGFDVTGGYVSGLVKNHEQVLQRFVTVLTKPSFPEKELQKLKDIFIDLFQRKKDSQTDIAVKQLKNLVYKDHPFEWTFDDAIEFIKSIDIKKLKALHKQYVTPKNMILAFSGNFDIDQVEKEIKKLFASWSGDKYSVDVLEKGSFEPGQKIDEFMLRDQVVLLLGRPSPLNVYHPDLVPVKMLNFIAFTSLGSRLYQLREQTGLFYTAFGSLGAGAERVNGFDFAGSILTLENVDKAEKLILGVIDNIGKNGVLESELNASKQSYLKGIIDLTETNRALAILHAMLKSLDLGFDYYDKVLNRAQAISLDEINKICAKYFDSKSMSRVRVGRIGKKD